MALKMCGDSGLKFVFVLQNVQTNFELIRTRLLHRAGIQHGPQPKRLRYEDLERSEWSPTFERFMRNRLIMGALRYGLFGDQAVRVRLPSGIQNMTQEAPQPNSITEYRTSISIVVEGYKLDSDFDVVPAFWSLVENYTSIPGQVEFTETTDLRSEQTNSVFNQRLPPGVPLSV